MNDPRTETASRESAARYLQPGEALRWSGRSDPSVLFSPADAFLIPFSVFWCGFVVFWESTALRQGAPPLFIAFGAVFALIGLHMLIGRFFVKRHRKRTTVYAVTDRRAFVATPRSVRDTPIGRTDRTVRWSRDRSHCSVQWNQGATGPWFGSRGNNSQVYANTGLDGLFGPQTMAFWDVSDGDALTRALDQ